MVRFFLGWHQPNNGPSGPGEFERCLISVNRLLDRQSVFKVNEWILDSGAFTRIYQRKGHLSVRQYAKEIDRWRRCGKFLAAVSQDFPCSAPALEATGLTLEQHQALTVHRFDRLRYELVEMRVDVLSRMDAWQNPITPGDIELDYDDPLWIVVQIRERSENLMQYWRDKVEAGEEDLPYLMPVLQGITPEDYAHHLDQYGTLIKPGSWIGVGSLVGRPYQDVEDILATIKSCRPDLQLHGFGLKKSVLNASPLCRALLYSADAIASLRGKTRGNNRPEDSLRYLQDLDLSQPHIV